MIKVYTIITDKIIIFTQDALFSWLQQRIFNSITLQSWKSYVILCSLFKPSSFYAQTWWDITCKSDKKQMKKKKRKQIFLCYFLRSLFFSFFDFFNQPLYVIARNGIRVQYPTDTTQHHSSPRTCFGCARSLFFLTKMRLP